MVRDWRRNKLDLPRLLPRMTRDAVRPDWRQLFVGSNRALYAACRSIEVACATASQTAIRSAAASSWHLEKIDVGTVALLAATPRQLDVREDLQEVSVGVAEEEGAVAEDLVGGRGEQGDAVSDELVGALIDFGDGNLEGQLKRGTPVRRWRILRSEAWPGQGQGVVAHPIFDPTWRKLSEERQAEDVFVEATHRGHVTHEDDRVVDRPNGSKRRLPLH